MDPNPTVRHSFWNVIIGGGLMWTGVYGINQAQVQRAVCFPSLAKAKLYVFCLQFSESFYTYLYVEDD